MKEMPLTQGQVALVGDEDYEFLSRWKWGLKSSGKQKYAVRVECLPRRRAIGMHNAIMMPPDGYVVDHINGNGLDNRRENLRVCTAAENRRNSRRYSNNKSGYKGVSWSSEKCKYRACLYINGNRKFLGYFLLPEKAALAYDEAARFYFGEYANLNFPNLPALER